jgi:hypothetical protein
MPCVKVHFYNPKKDTEGVWNKIVSYLDPPYCHCEIEFMQGLACAVYLNGSVHMKRRQFDPRFYDSLSIPCTTAAYDSALDYCTQRSEEVQPFSLGLMLGTKFAPLRYASSGTFCSKVCAEALQKGGVLGADVSPATITPSGLHRKLAQAIQPECHAGPIPALDFAV